MHVDKIVDGRYILKQCVGSGATGVVFRATQKVVDREVAVKLLNRAATDDANYRARFQREAKVLGRLDHPGFVRVFDFGWYAELEQPYLVTEFVQGLPLCDVFDELTPRQFLELVTRVCSALEHAHKKGIAHRDLKPANVLVPFDRNLDDVKVVDFGLAAILDNESIRMTQKGDAFGTPAYMSPEQCVGDEAIGPATDVYSLGCWMYEYFEGELPFTGSTASRVMIKHVTRPVPRLSDDTLPPELVALVEHTMAKSADDRPTMAEIGARVGALASGDAAWLDVVRAANAPEHDEDPTIRTTRPVPFVERYVGEASSLANDATTVAAEDVARATGDDQPLVSAEHRLLHGSTAPEEASIMMTGFGAKRGRWLGAFVALVAVVAVLLVWLDPSENSIASPAPPHTIETTEVAPEPPREEAEQLAQLPEADAANAASLAQDVVERSTKFQPPVVPEVPRTPADSPRRRTAKASSSTKSQPQAEATSAATAKDRPAAKLRY